MNRNSHEFLLLYMSFVLPPKNNAVHCLLRNNVRHFIEVKIKAFLKLFLLAYAAVGSLGHLLLNLS
ncbi:hypothetical protein M3B64_06130, partial [Lysinibacillus capsici]|uniref:hypothetical protein n=1 Tax=Lysinibacillus capsici TaxID=2115968 RepID=UPI0021A4307A